MKPSLRIAVLALLGALTWHPLVAQKAPKPVPLGDQIQALREGQAELMREMQEIKALLKAGAKADDSGLSKVQAHVVTNVFGEPFKGDPKARVAIMEYSDFDCTFCGRYAREIFPKLDEAYVKTGKVKYFFRDLPLPDHTEAPFKANLARMAGEQGKFWEAHEWLFAHQTPMDAKGVDLFAQALGLDKAKLQVGIDSQKYNRFIQASMDSARHFQLSGTPAFLIGTLNEDGSVFTATKVFMGAQSFEGYKGILDELLNPSPAPKSAAAKPAGSPQATADDTCGS